MMLAGRVLALGCARSTSVGFSLASTTVLSSNTYRGITQCMTYATTKSKSKSKPTPKPTLNKSNSSKHKATDLKVTKEAKGDVKSLSKKPSTKKGAESRLDAPPPKNTGPAVVFKRKRKKRATTSTMARAAKAYSRNQRRLAGDKSVGRITPEDEVLIEMYEQTEGHTIQVTREEFAATPEELSFEQLYRRILRSFEDHRIPQRELLFEMLNKSKSQEDWDNFVIIAKVYQSKLIMMRPHHASHIVHLAINKGFTNQIFEEMQKNILYLYPSKAGYHKLITELAKADQKDKVWKVLDLMAERGIQPSRQTISALITQSNEKDLDGALKFFKTGSDLGVRAQGVQAYALGRKLASLERWNDVLEVEKIVKKDNPTKEFRKLIPLIFLNAHIQSGNKEAVAQLTQEQINVLKEDMKQLEEADKQAFPFVATLAEAVPQLASA